MAPGSPNYKLYQEAIRTAQLIPTAINKRYAKKNYGAALVAYQRAELSEWKAKGGRHGK